MKNHQHSAYKPLKRVFIANRGEICRRIGMGCHKLGIEAATVLSKNTPIPLYLRDIIDHVVYVEEVQLALYLDPHKMIALAKEAGCDALHPGFGFLSENYEFAELCERSGLTFIGPKSHAIEAMASKAKARELAIKAGVPVTPGLNQFQNDNPEDIRKLHQFIEQHGFPILIKAALGGGGKGMRIIRSKDELDDGIQRASSEALRAFGDGSIIIERYLEKARHIEVQIIADGFGQVVAVGDRDCSVQRRHQKVLEEAPAPFIPDITRQKMHTAARALAQEVHYQSAGTVEFMLSWEEEGLSEDPPFYFLEMNTRLQVEHPVTEMVFGVDLVVEQLRVAGGYPLSDEFFELSAKGHSIEARLYAEDCVNFFLPAPGKVDHFVPYQSPYLRWECGIDRVDEISSAFDPMIAKLVATAPSREQALAALNDGLAKTVLCGVTNNLDYLRTILSQTPFRYKPVCTGFINEHHDAIVSATAKRKADRWLQNESLWQKTCQHKGELKALFGQDSPTSAYIQKLAYSPFDNSQIGTITEEHSFNHGLSFSHGMISYQNRTIQFGYYDDRQQSRWVYFLDGGELRTLNISDKATADAESEAEGSAHIKAPVPGKVIAILGQVGDMVEKDQKLFVLESMKMQFDVVAKKKGRIAEIKTSLLVSVSAQEHLMVLHTDV